MKIIAVSVFCLLVFSAAICSAADQSGVVKIHVVDPLGEPFEDSDWQLSFVRLWGGKDYAHKFEGSTATVPYGRYALRLSVPALVRYEREVLVYQPHVYMHVGLRLGKIWPTPRRLSGSLVPPPPKNRYIWVRMVPLHGNDNISMDSDLDDEGNFQFSGMTSGQYVLFVIEEEPGKVDYLRTLKTKQVSIRKDITTVRIDLEEEGSSGK